MPTLPTGFNRTIAAFALLASANGLFFIKNVQAQTVDAASVAVQAATSGVVAEAGNRVSLAASASVDVAHDWMSLSLSTTRDGADANTVQAQLRTALDAALAVARPKAEKDRLDLRTGNFSLSPRYGREGRIDGWQGSVELVLEGRDFERITATAGKVSSLTMNGISFGLSPQTRTALESDLQAQAIERFKTKAREITRAFGLGSYQLVEVNVGGVDGGEAAPRPMVMMAKSARVGVADAGVPAEPGRSTVQLSVNGTIRLK